jgi:hypothetical protein
MDYMKEIEHEYLLETGSDFSFLSNHGIFKTEISSLMLLYDNCNYDIEKSILYFLGSDYLNKNKIFNSIHPYLKEFYTFYENKIFANMDRIDFIRKSAHIYLDNYRGNPKIDNQKLDPLYKYPESGTKFVDLLSGFNFIHFFDGLDKNTIYYLVDKSLFTCECLNISIREKKLSNVFVINKDIKDVVVEDIGDKISVIRVNNIWCYIQNFQDYIPKYKSLLMQNGVFLFQEYSYVKILNLENNPYTWLDNCFKDNWEKEFTIQNTKNIRAFDTFIYRKLST